MGWSWLQVEEIARGGDVVAVVEIGEKLEEVPGRFVSK